MTEHTRFVVVTPVYNCEHTIRQTIMSVVAQAYDGPWRMLIRDDMSTDGTAAAVQAIINPDHGLAASRFYDLQDRISLTVNDRKHGEVENTLEAAKEIDPDEVIVRVDGGDWLCDLDMFAFLDVAYRQHDPACMWTAHRWGHTANNISGPLPRQDCDVYRELVGERWCTSHCKTWRRSAMDGIDDANYRDENGDLIMIACDRAIYLPIMHRALLDGKKRLFLPIVAYHYNIRLDDADLFTNDRSRLQRERADFIHRRGYIG